MTTPSDDDLTNRTDTELSPPGDDERVDSETPAPEPNSRRADEAASGAEPSEQVTDNPGEDPGDLALGTSREDLT